MKENEKVNNTMTFRKLFCWTPRLNGISYVQYILQELLCQFIVFYSIPHKVKVALVLKIDETSCAFPFETRDFIQNYFIWFCQQCL